MLIGVNIQTNMSRKKDVTLWSRFEIERLLHFYQRRQKEFNIGRKQKSAYENVLEDLRAENALVRLTIIIIINDIM